LPGTAVVHVADVVEEVAEPADGGIVVVGVEDDIVLVLLFEDHDEIELMFNSKSS
jgi:hypothetical protein